MESYHFFGAGNTCYGFQNFFSSISPTEDSFTYILKGSAGSGKSSIMKSVGKYFEERKFTVEYFYCSSDNESLDGVRIVEKNISIVDGTSPHTTEPTLIGIKENIINLGNFISPKIQKYKNDIKSLIKEKSMCYKKAYNYLTSIYNIIKVEELDSTCAVIKRDDYYNIIKQICNSQTRCNLKETENRNLFIKSVTKDGIISYEDKNQFKKIIEITNTNYFYNIKLLKEIIKFLKGTHIPFIAFHSLYKENEIESLFLFEENIYITINRKVKLKNQQIINTLFKKAGKNIEKAKKIHKNIEKYYIKNMDYSKVDKIIKNLIKKIELS